MKTSNLKTLFCTTAFVFASLSLMGVHRSAIASETYQHINFLTLSFKQMLGLEGAFAFEADTMLNAVNNGSAFDISALNSKRISVEHQNTIRDFYQNRDGQAYWLLKDDFSSKTKKLLKTLQASWTHGLNPNSYHYKELSEMAETLAVSPEVSKIHFEVLLTDAFIRYARDLSGMRINPRNFDLEPTDWRDRQSAHEGIHWLEKDMRFSKVLKNIEPQGATYQALRRGLIRLVQAEFNNKEQDAFEPIQISGLLKPGRKHKAVPALRRRLNVRAMQGDDETVYDHTLETAVLKFQKENQLYVDGIVGADTLEVLNRDNSSKIMKLIVNMERMRWDKPSNARRSVMVNLPSATLWAIENNRVVLEMPVIVGKPKRPTKSFKTEISGVRFNPDWTVPPTIKRVDIWPKLKEDPSYVTQKGMTLYDGYGRSSNVLNPHDIEWGELSSRELHAIRMVQKPGDFNPLGRYRILMPNTYNIYLHDTNHPEYFERTSRALSSGCMRMKYPQKMAKFVMEGAKNWNDNKIDGILQTGKVTDLRINEKIPFKSVYYTTWLDEKGDIIYGKDIYKYDAKLFAALSKLDGYQTPRHDNNARHALMSYADLVSFE